MREQSNPGKPPSSRTVEDALRPHRKALAGLLRTPALPLGDVGAALAQLTEVAVEVLDVERASVWSFDTTRSRIECMDLYERKRHAHSRGLVIERVGAPRYFAALEEERTITAANAETDPRTSEFADGYLRPLGIGAMLDAPVFAGPTLIGVVCHEHVGGPRAWKLWEELVAGTLADFVALVLATSERIASDRALDDYRKHLEELVEERTSALRETEAGLSKLFAASPVAWP
jgi:GAF domain-containing protein